MPASENRKNVIATHSAGAYEKRPPYDEISPERVLRATTITTANAPMFITA